MMVIMLLTVIYYLPHIILWMSHLSIHLPLELHHKVGVCVTCHWSGDSVNEQCGRCPALSSPAQLLHSGLWLLLWGGSFS